MHGSEGGEDALSFPTPIISAISEFEHQIYSPLDLKGLSILFDLKLVDMYTILNKF